MIWVIYKKEFLGFLKSPLFYLLTFLSTILLSITFSMGIQNFAMTQTNAMIQMGMSAQQLNVHYSVFLQHLSFINLLFMFFIPALAMRLLSEEKKLRTFDLLLTSPIQSYEIVIGKFLSLMSVAVSILLVAFLYIVFASRMFEFQWAPTVIATLGIVLVAAVYSAISLFASSLSDNTLVALVLGILLNISLWIFGGFSEIVDEPFLKSFFDQTSLNNHLQVMIEGVIKLNGLVFFLSLVFLFCFLTERIVESSRWKA